MSFLEQLRRILRSRKFWALVASLVGVLSAFLLQEINVWQALQLAVGALAVYSTGVAIEGPYKP
jgi:uncharacterized membrane protein